MPYLQAARVRPAFTFAFSGTVKPAGVASIAATTICWISSSGCLYSLLHIGFECTKSCLREEKVPATKSG